MEEPKSTAGQGLGIAALVLGILAIPIGIFPCTFYIGILFGVIGIVLSLVALSQANRGYGPKGLIIAALICSIVGLTFASIWGFTFSRGGAKVFKEIIHNENFRDFGHDGDVFNTETDTNMEQGTDMEDMTDTLKALEGEDTIQ
jgi:hypothetical protein